VRRVVRNSSKVSLRVCRMVRGEVARDKRPEGPPPVRYCCELIFSGCPKKGSLPARRRMGVAVVTATLTVDDVAA